jgi:uncharacterized protein (TIGR03000 family)
MYSAVLLLAMAGAVDAPGWGYHCGGCYSGCYSSCGYGYGYCCSSSYNYPCYGYNSGYSYPCYGYYSGYSYPCYGYSSCYSYPYYGYCYPSSYSGGGYVAANYTASFPQAQGETDEEYKYCQDKSKDMSPEAYSSFRSGVWLRMTNAERKKMMDKEKKVNPTTLDDKPVLRTEIVVRLPADAKLFVDDVICPLGSATRTFKTPGLKAGQAYAYTFRAEVTRNGVVRSTTQRVRFDAGKAVELDLRDALNTTVAER